MTKDIRSDAIYLINAGFTSGEMEAIRMEFGFQEDDIRALHLEMKKQELRKKLRKYSTSSKNPATKARKRRERKNAMSNCRRASSFAG